MRTKISTSLDKRLYTKIKEIARKNNVDANFLIEQGMIKEIENYTEESFDLESEGRYEDKFTIPLRKFCRDLGIFKNEAYKMIKNNELEAIKKKPKIGKTRYFVKESQYKEMKNNKDLKDLGANKIIKKINELENKIDKAIEIAKTK